MVFCTKERHFEKKKQKKVTILNLQREKKFSLKLNTLKTGKSKID